MKITILGAGMVGSAIARDLAQEESFEVVSIDRSREALNRLEARVPVTGVQADLVASPVSPLIDGSDLVINAVPGFMGFETLRRIVEAGKNVVDISFFPEDPFALDDLARDAGVTAVVDCGVAPGLCNILAGHIHAQLDTTDRYVCYVGGLPQARHRPFEYKAVFSPADVIEEYTRPARYVVGGEAVVRPALSDVELIDFPEVGTLEAFNTDGLRTLRHTLPISQMQEKTLRYPGHAALMRVFRDAGFFDKAPVHVDGVSISPLSLTSRLLFDQWRLEEGEPDVTIMQVVVEGRHRGEHVRHTFDLVDRYDAATQTSAMARTTGYTCAIVARQLLQGMIDQKGICPPEHVGATPGCVEHLMAAYAARGIHLQETIVRGGDRR